MKVKLLKDIMEGNNVKTSIRRGRAVPFIQGAVIECSEGTAAKWIEKGLAEPYAEEKAKE